MIYVILSPKINESYIDSNLMNRKKENMKNGINTGVIQKVLPVLSTETLLHIWLSTEYYGFRPSSTAVDTWGTRGLMMSK